MSPRTDLELQLPELFDTHPVPMCVYDPQTLRLLAVNPAAVARYGYTEAELLGMPLDALLAPEDVPRFHAVVIRSGESPQSHTGQWQHRTKDGSTFPVRLSIGATDLGGRRVFACILHDLSAFKRVEQQLHQSQKMEAIGQLAGGVAHDFNNLLTVIMGYGSLLQGMVPAWDPKRPMLDEIVATADRAAAVTHQLLAVSRAPAADPIVLDPNRVITDLTRLLQRAIGPELGLDTALDPTARCVRI
ncbi:MAG TPA: PAS domain S-box protein, partial [Gemmataceae bacterium]|nr:PAS domain S-box protein [Gemmataceae bacterium]